MNGPARRLGNRIGLWLVEADRTPEELRAAYPDILPRTKGEALAVAQMWGHTLSHNDSCFTLPDGRFDAARCAAADAAEVVKLAALWTMLPESS